MTCFALVPGLAVAPLIVKRTRVHVRTAARIAVHLVVSLAVCFVSVPAAAQPASYHDVGSMEAAIALFDGMAGGRMRVRMIGTTWYGRPVNAVQISETPNFPGTAVEKSADDKPALLVECGMHAREWAGPELCLHFLQWFAFGFVLTPARINDILAHADVWVIPMVNPDGRGIDDAHGGDPTQHWTNTYYHNGDSAGWRDNAQAVTCAAMSPAFGWGIDIARSFSAGWSAANPDCTSNDFRGDAPFQAREAQILRRFVENRMIAMSLSVHSNIQGMGIRASSLNAIRDNVISLWNSAVPGLPLGTGPTGGGSGQFPAWMADISDTPLQPDTGTRRGAVALLMELPMPNASYGAPYQSNSGDGSNGFHPSAQAFLNDTLPGFVSALAHLAEQARRPWCPLTPGSLTPSAACGRDVGLTGAKIALCTDCVGTLSEAPFGVGSRQTTFAGVKTIAYRNQNFDSSATATVQTIVTVTSKPIGGSLSYSTDLLSTASSTLASGEAASGSVPFTFVAGRDYVVTVQTWPVTYTGETNTQNNVRQFRFIVP